MVVSNEKIRILINLSVIHYKISLSTKGILDLVYAHYKSQNVWKTLHFWYFLSKTKKFERRRGLERERVELDTKKKEALISSIIHHCILRIMWVLFEILKSNIQSKFGSSLSPRH